MVKNVDDDMKMITVEVNVPADAIVGRYKFIVEVTTSLADGPKTERKAMSEIYVLFNPFSQGKLF